MKEQGDVFASRQLGLRLTAIEVEAISKKIKNVDCV